MRRALIDPVTVLSMAQQGRAGRQDRAGRSRTERTGQGQADTTNSDRAEQGGEGRAEAAIQGSRQSAEGSRRAPPPTPTPPPGPAPKHVASGCTATSDCIQAQPVYHICTNKSTRLFLFQYVVEWATLAPLCDSQAVPPEQLTHRTHVLNAPKNVDDMEV